MGDSLVQPCLQESEQFPEMYEDIERQRADLEDIAGFARAVSEHQAYVRCHARTMCGAELFEDSDLAGLVAHSREPCPGEDLLSLGDPFWKGIRFKQTEKISCGTVLRATCWWHEFCRGQS